MPNRNDVGDYRYAYQGQEKDPETGKEAFQLRLWDARIGRWLTTDPYGQYNSPYLGMGNDPINGIDPDGGWRTWASAAWAWLNGSYGGKIQKFKDVTDPNKRYGIVQSLESDAGFKFSYSMDGYTLNNLNSYDQEIISRYGGIENLPASNRSLKRKLDGVKISDMKAGNAEIMQERVGSVYKAGAEYGLVGSGLGMGQVGAFKKAVDLKNLVQVGNVGYESMGQITVAVKKLDLLKYLNKNVARGEWVKVYDAAIINGVKNEVHYFKHAKKGIIFDSKIKKANAWTKNFTKGKYKIQG